MADVNSAHYWEQNYRQGRTGWDLGEPTPVFRRLADNGRFPPGKMIVLGAGRGYDARLFARRGFEVTAVDFAPGAVEAMRRRAEPAAPLEIIQADLFALPFSCNGRFDYVLEYTCFCAIDPARRPAYADVVARLLQPGGRYIALAFPTGDRQGGPPFSVSPAELAELLQERGFHLRHRETPPDSVPARRGAEELLILQKSLPS